MPTSGVQRSSFLMNLLPSEWLFRMRSNRDFWELYFLWAVLLNWYVGPPAACFYFMSEDTSSEVSPLRVLSGIGARTVAPFA